MRKVDTADITAGDYADVLSTINLLEQSFDEGTFDVHEALLGSAFAFTSPFGSFTTVGEYMGWLKSFYDTVKAQGGTRHVVTNPIVRIDGDEAAVFSYLTVINRTTMTFMGTSTLHDVLRKQNGRWKCVSREVLSDQFAHGEAITK